MCRRLGTATSTALAVAVALFALAGCSEPALHEGPVESTDTGEIPSADDVDDPAADALREHLALVVATMDEARDHLQAAADATSLSQARRRTELALPLLLEDAGSSAASQPLLPVESPEREATAERADLLGATLALARDVGGDQGSAVIDLLRDEVAGDLGAWERDAAGVVAAAERAAGDGGDLDRVTERILELPGEATRALAWTLVAAEAPDAELATVAASRAAAHLGLALAATEELGVATTRSSGG